MVIYLKNVAQVEQEIANLLVFGTIGCALISPILINENGSLFSNMFAFLNCLDITILFES